MTNTMYRGGFLLAIVACGAWAADQPVGDLGGYNALRLDQAGVFVGGFNGTIERLSDGVKITLLSDDPAKKPLPISANQMAFTWPESGAKRPTRILLEGKVVIEHPQATVRAEKADWDMEKGILTFTGKPVMSTPQVQELTGEKIVLDFNKGGFEVFGGKAKVIRFNQEGGEGEAAAGGVPVLLRESDVKDWGAFLDLMKTGASSKEASPGRQVFALLEAKVQKFIATVPAATLLEDKSAILKQVNRVLTNPKLYKAEAFQGVTVDPEIKKLLEQGGLSAAEQARVNRALLAAAFPHIIAKSE